MRKSYILFLIGVIIAISSSALYAEDNFEYVSSISDETNKFYIDKTSITRTNTPNIIRCWYRNITTSNLDEEYYMLSRHCVEINLAQNTYKHVEVYIYSTSGYYGGRKFTHSDWIKIPPDSVMDAICKTIKRITRYNSFFNLDAEGTVFIFLIGGVTIIALIVAWYMKFTPSASSNLNDTQDTPKYDFHHTGDKATHDFDYPYEDIGNITGL